MERRPVGQVDWSLVVDYSVWGGMQGRAGQGKSGLCWNQQREGWRIVALAVYIDKHKQTHNLHRLTRKKNTILSSKGIWAMAFRRPSTVQEFWHCCIVLSSTDVLGHIHSCPEILAGCRLTMSHRWCWQARPGVPSILYPDWATVTKNRIWPSKSAKKGSDFNLMQHQFS